MRGEPFHGDEQVWIHVQGSFEQRGMVLILLRSFQKGPVTAPPFLLFFNNIYYNNDKLCYKYCYFKCDWNDWGSTFTHSGNGCALCVRVGGNENKKRELPSSLQHSLSPSLSFHKFVSWPRRACKFVEPSFTLSPSCVIFYSLLLLLIAFTILVVCIFIQGRLASLPLFYLYTLTSTDIIIK